MSVLFLAFGGLECNFVTGYICLTGEFAGHLGLTLATFAIQPPKQASSLIETRWRVQSHIKPHT